MLQRRTDWKKQILSVALALLMLLGSTPQPVLAAAGEILSVSAVPLGAAAGSSVENPFAGKTLSILGDSISTYTGVSNNKADNPTLAGGAIYYTAGRLGVYREDTWWQQTADQLGMNVLVNNSWSGSAMLNTRSGTVGAYLNRCVQLHNAAGEDPDIIAYYLGTNDFSEFLGGKCTLGTEDINYAALISQSASGYVYATPTTVCEAYAIALHKTSVRYPDAEIYCLTPLVRTGQSAARIQYAKAFNEALQAIAAHFGAIPVNLYQDTGILDNRFFSTYVSDNSLHPGPLGMDAITGCLISAMLEHSRYSQAQTHSVTYTLNDTMVEQGTVCTVAAGEAFRCSLRAPAGYETTVSVTMGGKDVTADCYQNGKIYIPSVTGDIEITAASVKQATNYRWEFAGSAVTSVTENNNRANALTKLGGSLTDGVLQSAYFQMAEAVVLYHHRPWVVEWSAAGNWSGMLLSKQQTSSTEGNTYFFKTNGTNGFMGFGQRVGSQYHNYGIELGALGIDTTTKHTYRLVNKPADDGANMVYLWVDGVNCGALNNYYIGGSSNQGVKVDWLSGKDLTFSYIGANSHLINNCALDYVQVWESGVPHTHAYTAVVTPPTCTERGYTTHTCACGDRYVDNYVDAQGHSYNNGVCAVCQTVSPLYGKNVSILGDSISTFAGVSQCASSYYNGSNRGVQSVYDTWWGKLIEDHGMSLCVNYSQGGIAMFNSVVYNDRTVKLHTDRSSPDIIFVFLGHNDKLEQVKPFEDVRWSTIIQKKADGTYTYATPDSFTEAYVISVHKMLAEYPAAEIVLLQCLTDGTLEKYNQMNPIIQAIGDKFGLTVVDFYGKGLSRENKTYFPSDVHPNKAGMNKMTEILGQVLENTHLHSFNAVVTPPTCTEQGYTTHTCACGESYVDGYVEELGHSYDDGKCAMCDCDMLRVTAEDIIRYQGGVSADNGTLNTTFTNNWYSDIRIPKGAQQVRVMTFKTGGRWGSAFFNGTEYVSGFCDSEVGGKWIIVDIPRDATVFRYGYLYDQIAQNNGIPVFEYVEFVGEELENWETSQYMERPATGCHSFSVEVNIAPAQGKPNGYVKGTDYGYIQLPTNYSAYGEPTRLIIVCHGAGASLSTYKSSAWKNTNYSFWTDLGYAVMDMYASPQELTGSTSELHYGNPVVLECYKKGYDYVMQHFNLKQDGIFLIGSSMGGLSSFQIAQSGQFPVIAQVAYCPVIDLFKQAYCNPWTTASYQRSRIANYFGFAGTAPAFTNNRYPSAQEIEFFRQNADKITTYSPILRNVIDGDIAALFNIIPTSPTATSAEEAALYAGLTATHPNPLLVFHNTDDGTVAYRYSQYFVEMVNRSGQEAVLRTFTSGNHNAWANGENKTVQGINGTITIKESQYEAYLFFDKFEQHESHCPWTDPAKVPTCNASGLTEGSHCAVCGEVLKKQEPVPATGHKFTRYIGDGNATLYADGTKTALCDHGCGAKDTVADVGSMLFPEQVTSQIYPIADGWLTGAPEGTTVQTLLSGLDWGKYCAVFRADGRPVAADAAVGTGMVLKLQQNGQTKQSVTIVVMGDTSGDGAVNETDLAQVRNHLLQAQQLTGAFAKAADCSGDGIVSVTDIIRLQALLLR